MGERPSLSLPGSDDSIPAAQVRMTLCNSNLEVLFSSVGTYTDVLGELLLMVDTPEGHRRIACIKSLEWLV